MSLRWQRKEITVVVTLVLVAATVMIARPILRNSVTKNVVSGIAGGVVEEDPTYLVVEFELQLMLGIDGDGNVTGVFQLNEGAKIFTNYDFGYMNLSEAIDRIVKLARSNGYLMKSDGLRVSMLDGGRNSMDLERAIEIFGNNGIGVERVVLSEVRQRELRLVMENYDEEGLWGNGDTEEGSPNTVEGDIDPDMDPGDDENSNGGGVAEPSVVAFPPSSLVVPEEKTFTATFDPNGATSIGAGNLSCKTAEGSCVVVAPSITRAGFSIFGWSANTAGIYLIDVGGQIILTGNATFYAITMDDLNYMDAGGMLSLINSERNKIGVGDLNISSSLIRSAKIRAEEICRAPSHTRPDGSSWTTVSPLAFGENIAGGNSTIAATFAQWMGSEGHRNNMMSSRFNTMGIAGYFCPAGIYRYYWVQLFGL